MGRDLERRSLGGVVAGRQGWPLGGNVGKGTGDVERSMPELIAAQLIPLLVNAGAVGAFGFAGTAAIALGASYLLLAGGAYLLASVVSGPQNQGRAPKPEDGKFNLKQSVPPLVYVLGRVKKASDYAFLEEANGAAYHILVWAAHSISGFSQHYLHNEAVERDADGYVDTPANMRGNVLIKTREGAAASTAYSEVVAAFPSIWTEDHRGDGLATVMVLVGSVAIEDLQTVFPNGMPQHSAVGDGNDQLYDPRDGTYDYDTNIALFRLWHLTHPVGGRLTLDDMYLPDWSVAAAVADEYVLDRNGNQVRRYHGGLWFRADNDPVDIGRILDQAGEMVIYERPDGKVGVHPGKFVTPDIRLVASDIVSLTYDANKRKGTTVIAVRGRYTDPAKGYNTADAAIYGVPYPSDDERTKTVDNQAVQHPNHMARLQKPAFIRANAPRVSIRAHYEPAKEVPYRRFVRVHMPPKMVEAVVEILDRPKLSLRNLTYEFSGIVVPEALYAFDAATEEGVPGSNIVPVERGDIPVPEGFDVTIEEDSVGGGTAYFGLATWDTVPDDVYIYELEWEPVAGGPRQTVSSGSGAGQVRTAYLADDVALKFRLRRWSAGARSDWTGYITRTP